MPQGRLRAEHLPVRVSLGAHTITVWNGKKIILHDEPAGVGRSIGAEPAGTYYLAELLAADRIQRRSTVPTPSGPLGALEVLYSFGGGPGQIGLHGTNEPACSARTTSHGCIRISNTGITKLARILPLGTPVRISY